MQIRCRHCTKTLALAADGTLPTSCPHCAAAPGPGRLGPYEPERLLAAGGMGEVYLGRHVELGTEVALKLLPALPLGQLAAVRERFAREARLTAAVSHPGVVQVLASDVAGDRPFLVLELVRGTTLRQQLVSGPLPVVDAVRVAAATADVLAAAHGHGVLHRDVKPDNVMLQHDGSVRVLDFGIARAIADDAPLTHTGELLGTPEYMAPEQLLFGPEAVDVRTDVHALGVLTYELLTGRSPFRGSSLFQALKLVESLVPPPPSSLVPAVPAAVDDVVARALAKPTDQRWPTAAAFAAALRAALPSAAGHPATPVWWRWLPLAAGALLAVAGIATSLRTVPTPAPTPAAPIAERDDMVERTVITHLLATGRWVEATARATRAVQRGDAAARPLAQQAFVRHHTVWPLLLELPRWLCACDEGERRHLFGSGREPADGGDDDVFAAWDRLLQPTPTASPDEALVVLLAMRALPTDRRAEAMAAYAQRLSLDTAEHWLARLCERHWRGDAAGREQAAELAWLHGAGELAVLLDAGAQVLPPDDEHPAPPLPTAALARLRRRVLAGVGADAPAATMLHAVLAAATGRTPELTALRQCAPTWRSPGGTWLLAVALRRADLRDLLLLAATALGQRPDYGTPPWSDVPGAHRAAIDAEVAEVQRGR